MRELLLDAETLYTRDQAHDALAKVFGFPADYGRNLDALYDLLTAYPAARLTLRAPAAVSLKGCSRPAAPSNRRQQKQAYR